ncbi:hypothetical protein ACWGIN_27520 [Streptomyces sp. NPDC054861]
MLAVVAAFGITLGWEEVNAAGLGVVAALGSVVAALASWAATSRASNTAASLAAIERDRWHAELTPEFEISVARLGPGTQRLRFRIKLIGPVGLRGLDEVRVMVDDDEVERPVVTPPPPTEQDLAEQVWGPARFVPGIDGVEGNGRKARLHAVRPGRVKRLDMEPTKPPFWQNYPEAPLQWSLQYRSEPVRLWIECHAEGHRPWFLHRDVTIEEPGVGLA